MSNLPNAHHLHYWIKNGNYQTVCEIIDQLSLKLKEESAWTHDEEALDFYRKAIRYKKHLTLSEEQQLMRNYQNGDEKALWELVRHNSGYLMKFARKYQAHGLLLNDLISEGTLGLIKACRNYDISRGYRLITFAQMYIKSYLSNAISSLGSIIKYPSTLAQDFYKLQQLKDRIEQEYGDFSTPLYNDITDAEGFSADSVWLFEHRKISCFSIDGLESYLNEEESIHHTLCTLKIMDSFDVMEEMDEDLYWESFKIDLKNELETLNDRERGVIKMYFGLDCNTMTLDEISCKYKLSKERVRQIKQKALLKLHTSELLRGYL